MSSTVTSRPKPDADIKREPTTPGGSSATGANGPEALVAAGAASTKPKGKDQAADDEDEEPKYKPIEWSLVRRLLTWLKPFRKQYTIGISLGLVHLLLELMSPTFMRWIIDYITGFVNKR